MSAEGPGRIAALEAEVARLRAALAHAAGAEADGDGDTSGLVAERHAREMAAGRSGLARAEALNEALRTSNAALEASRGALTESEERLRLILENARDYAIFTTDPEDRISGWYPGAAAIFGWTAEEILGQPSAVLYTPEDRERGVPEREAGMARRDGVAPNVRWHVRRDGSRVFIEGMRTVLRGPDGTLRGFLKIGQDVTERRAAEAALRASEERLRSAAEVGRLGLWDWDLRTGEIVWSDEYFRMAGHAVGEVRPDYGAWIARLHPEDRAGAEAALLRARETREEFVREFRMVHPDGSIHWCSARGRFFVDEADEPVRMVGAMVETTERREWEERQKVLVAELQHRTRNLIAVVRALSNRMLSSSGSLEEYRERFRTRLEALSRVNGLLSRLDEGDRISFDGLIRAELAAHGAVDAAGRGAQVVLDGPSGIRLRSATVQTLALALHELATNAVKYGALSTPKGRVRVAWGMMEAAEEGGPWLRVVWEETGVAMPARAAGTPMLRGYGRELIERALPYQLKARTLYEMGPEGVRCELELPVAQFGAGSGAELGAEGGGGG
ncbi:sensor histidine kinase [Roseomonas sp. WA12]